jgi:hypothetical protein
MNGARRLWQFRRSFGGSRIHLEDSSVKWLPMVKRFMKVLWQEEIHVSIAVMASLKANTEF